MTDTTHHYRTIVVDPPWEHTKVTGKRTDDNAGSSWNELTGIASVLPYETMSLREIASLPVPRLAHADCNLFLWTFGKWVPDAYRLAVGWGFDPVTLLTWCKAPRGLGLGGAFVPTTEFMLYARQGRENRLGRCDTTWWEWPRGRHSEKPAAAYTTIASVSPVPRIDLFARRPRPGWDVWGDDPWLDAWGGRSSVRLPDDP